MQTINDLRGKEIHIVLADLRTRISECLGQMDNVRSIARFRQKKSSPSSTDYAKLAAALYLVELLTAVLTRLQLSWETPGIGSGPRTAMSCSESCQYCQASFLDLDGEDDELPF
jgi:hypothetical protein